MMHDLLRALRHAVAHGAALGVVTVGCGGTVDPSPSTDASSTTDVGSWTEVGSSTDDGSFSDRPVLADSARPVLEAYPADLVACHGEIADGGSYSGQCCTKVACYASGGEACLNLDQLQTALRASPVAEPDRYQALRDVWPKGSGTCSCAIEWSDDGRPLIEKGTARGPYAGGPGAADPAGQCCYLAASIGCTGRPFVVEHEAQVAALVVRGDWMGPRA